MMISRYNVFFRHIQYLLLIVLLGVSPSKAEAQQAPLKIIVFGDSLTSGYQLDPKASFPEVLERKLLSDGYQVDVMNMSVAGETTSGALARLQDVLNLAPDIVIVELGANDALRGIDVKKIVLPNLNKIVFKIRNQGAGVLLVGMKSPPNMGKAYGTQFNSIYHEIAAKNRTSLYPFVLEGVVTRPDLNLADGFHPNEKGVLMMVQNMYPEVKKLVKWRIDYLKHQQSQK